MTGIAPVIPEPLLFRAGWAMATPQSPTEQALFSTSLLVLQAAEKSQGNLSTARWMQGPSSLPEEGDPGENKTVYCLLLFPQKFEIKYPLV